MSLTIQTSNALANHLYRNVTFASPPQVWMGLVTADGNELSPSSSLGYARVRLDDKLAPPAGGIVESNDPVSFPVADSTWTARRVGLWTAQTEDTLLQTIDLPSAVTVAAGVILRFPAGSIRLGLGSIPDGYWLDGQRAPLPTVSIGGVTSSINFAGALKSSGQVNSNFVITGNNFNLDTSLL